MKTPEPPTIAAAWSGFRLLRIPNDAPPVQLREMRRAFYGGCHHLLDTILHHYDPELGPPHPDLDVLERLANEIEAFSQAMRRGDA